MLIMTPSERHHSPTFPEVKLFIQNEETAVPNNTEYEIFCFRNFKNSFLLIST
jgi:hypothetical protein